MAAISKRLTETRKENEESESLEMFTEMDVWKDIAESQCPPQTLVQQAEKCTTFLKAKKKTHKKLLCNI